MEYVIVLLEKEKYILEKCLNEWESKEYPLAEKERINNLKDIDTCLGLIIMYKNENK